MKKRKRLVEIFASSLLALSLLTGCSNTNPELNEDAKYCYEMTHGELSESEVDEILRADTCYKDCGFKNSENVRTLITKDKPLYIVPTAEFLKFNSYILEDFTKELNAIFKIINPDIKFVYSETMPEGEHNVLTFKVVDSLDNVDTSASGIAYMKDYVKYNKQIFTYDCSIEIDRNYRIENYGMVSLEKLVAHEVGHILGFGHVEDEDNETKTVMKAQGLGSVGGYGYYSLNDLYLLASRYGSFDNEEEVLSVKEKLIEYHSQEKTSIKPLLPSFKPSLLPPLNNKNNEFNKWFDKTTPSQENKWGNNLDDTITWREKVMN